MKKKYVFTTIILFFLLILLAPQKIQAETVAKVRIAVIQDYDQARQVLTKLNSMRAQKGLSQLVLDETLCNIAMQRAADCQLYYSHTTPNGGQWIDSYPSGYCWAENIACGQEDAAAVMKSWTNSQGHYENMMDARFTKIGVGCVENGDVRTWVQVFGTGTANVSVKSGSKNTVATVSILPSYLHLSLLTIPNDEITYNESYYFSMINTANANGTGKKTVIYPDDLTVTSSNPSVLKYNSNDDMFLACGAGSTTITVASSLDSRITVSKTYTVSASKLELYFATIPKANYTYTGQELHPTVVVYDENTNKLQKNIDYTVTYMNAKNPGTATVIVKGMGMYEGTMTLHFKIQVSLKKPVIASGKPSAKGKVKLVWKKVSGVSGYRIRYSQRSNMTATKTVKVASAGKLTTTLTKLKSGKKYYVQVQTYKKIEGKVYYSSWSSKKSIKAK